LDAGADTLDSAGPATAAGRDSAAEVFFVRFAATLAGPAILSGFAAALA
jgi:hypothetical protein